MDVIEIKGMRIGEGVPKTIVSLMGADEATPLEQARKGIEAGADCFEYRADFAADPHDAVEMVRIARVLAGALPDNPLLFTFRSESQGGRTTLDADEYVALCRAVIEDGAVDAIDVESWIGDDAVRELCMAAHDAGVAAVVSFHDFECTPPADEMVQMLERFSELGADIPKIAVMAKSARDALDLLDATERVRSAGTTGPLLTMAMGAQGSITRLAGEQFGSALTFCALEHASAPGQVDVAQARSIMQQLHEISSRA